MTINQSATVIGLTGPFGSGSTTAGNILAERKGFHHVRLSQVVKDKWQEQNQGKVATRSELQKLGNRIRTDAKDPGILAQIAYSTIAESNKSHDKIVFDGIRNLGEIEKLRSLFGFRFYVFAFECQPSERWERMRAREYENTGLTREQFISDNEDDKDQENVYGQQVQLCVDEADVLIDNESDVPLSELRTKLSEYLDLVTGVKPRYASPAEIFMNLAYSSSHASKCLKRQVGAVLVAAGPGKMGDVVALGFNENPLGTSPCVDERKYGADPAQNKQGKCYRDIVRHESFVQLARAKNVCPACGSPITGITESPP